MENHTTKFFDNYEEFMRAGESMSAFQRTHNIIRNDYQELLKLAESASGNQNQFNGLYRACLRELFSLIESDLFGLNKLDKYQGYKDYEKFVAKFKKTFEQIGKTWNKEAIEQEYLKSKFQSLLDIKNERDKTTHPKSPDDFKAITMDDFLKLKTVYKDYDDFINSLMNGFFIGMKNFPMNKMKSQ